MDAKLSPGSGVLILLGVACLFASNHLCARIAFDHGASVVAAVSVRAAFTSLVLLAGERGPGLSPPPPRAPRGRDAPAGRPLRAPKRCPSPPVDALRPGAALLL